MCWTTEELRQAYIECLQQNGAGEEEAKTIFSEYLPVLDARALSNSVFEESKALLEAWKEGVNGAQWAAYALEMRETFNKLDEELGHDGCLDDAAKKRKVSKGEPLTYGELAYYDRKIASYLCSAHRFSFEDAIAAVNRYFPAMLYIDDYHGNPSEWADRLADASKSGVTSEAWIAHAKNVREKYRVARTGVRFLSMNQERLKKMRKGK